MEEREGGPRDGVSVVEEKEQLRVGDLQGKREATEEGTQRQPPQPLPQVPHRQLPQEIPTPTPKVPSPPLTHSLTHSFSFSLFILSFVSPKSPLTLLSQEAY